MNERLAEDVAKQLKNAKRQSDGSWMACYPAHNERTPSLSIKDGSKVPLVYKFLDEFHASLKDSNNHQHVFIRKKSKIYLSNCNF